MSMDWFTIPELSWMIIGERMNEGALLYVDIWDDIGPLSAWSYRIIDFVFGRSQLAIQIIGLIIFLFQIFFINYISLRHKMYNENNYLPALFYGLLGLVFFNIVTLSPHLLGLTFVLISFNHLFNHVETRNKTDGNLLNIGLYIGIASLFYLPFFLMMFVHVIGLVFFTNTIGRRYLLLIYGVIIPFIITWLIYAWHGGGINFSGIFLHSILDFESTKFLALKSILILGSTTILLFVIASLKILSGFGYTVFQVRIQKIMFLAAMVMLIIYTVYSDHDGYGLIIFFPWIAFFASHFFIKIKNSLKRELSFSIYFFTIIAIYIGVTFQLFGFKNFIEFDSLMVKNYSENVVYTGKKILILGQDISPYVISKQATPYFNWRLSQDQLTNLDYYDNLESINKNFRKDMPDFIIDQIGLAPEIFHQIPLLGAEYKSVKNGIYQRVAKPSN